MVSTFCSGDLSDAKSAEYRRGAEVFDMRWFNDMSRRRTERHPRLPALAVAEKTAESAEKSLVASVFVEELTNEEGKWEHKGCCYTRAMREDNSGNVR
jgi:hypothetical protein